MDDELASLIWDDTLPLHEKLEKYSHSNIYPFHMPGHKRQDMGIVHPELVDITEIEGFDNLHHADGILKNEQEHMARVYGADHSFFLVNGSTAGILTAVLSAVPRGGKIVVSRNCHKSVFHAMLLRELEAVYLYPQETESGVQGSINPDDVEKALAENPDAQAVLITSPTFDGVVSDVETIAKIVHKYDLPFIVDEAHGAHFGFSDKFPKKALSLGADLVIESMHKMLPAYTQTAALHVMGDRVGCDVIKKYLSVFQTSSPSYILMAGLTRCTCILENEGPALMEAHHERLMNFYSKMQDLHCLKVLLPPALTESGVEPEGIWKRDISRILIFCQRAGINGQELFDRLLYEYDLHLEMASGDYVTALTSMMDTDEGFERLADALLEIDRGFVAEGRARESSKETEEIHRLYLPRDKEMDIYEANDQHKKTIPLEDADGEVSGEFVYLYPPGIPFLVPGEVIPDGFAESIARLKEAHYAVHGMADLKAETIYVLEKDAEPVKPAVKQAPDARKPHRVEEALCTA